MLEIEGLTHQYKGRPDKALDGIRLTIAPGEFVSILGRSGSGKSTLIRCINRLVEPNAGSIRWMSRPITGVSARRLRKLRSGIGMVFQHFNLLPRLSVLTNVMAGTLSEKSWWQGIVYPFTKKDRERGLEALRRVGLSHLADKRVEELSGGQKQRVAIARVMVQNPKLLLGDEPVSSLDPVTAVQILKHISRLHRQEGLTVVMNLHDVGIAREYSTRIIGMRKGAIVFDGPPERLGEPELLRIYPGDDDE